MLAEAVEAEVGDGVAALQAGQQLGDGVAPVHGVGPVGADEDQRAAVGLGEALEEGDALGVGPVEVLEHHHGPAAHLPDLRRQAAHGLEADEHPLLERPGAVGHDGEGVGIDVEAVEGVEQQLEGTAEGAGLGLAGEHRHAGGHPVAELADEAGLPDAGFAADQGDRRRAAGADRHELGEAVELGGPTDHHRAQADPSVEHARSVRASPPGPGRVPGLGGDRQAARRSIPLGVRPSGIDGSATGDVAPSTATDRWRRRRPTSRWLRARASYRVRRSVAASTWWE